MLRVVVLVSGGGTNLQAIIDAIKADKITNAELVGVISNNKTVKSLDNIVNGADIDRNYFENSLYCVIRSKIIL